MKILYSVQATGNGHISRAMEILPYLELYGQVDIFLSGANSSLSLDLPIKYRSKGLCIFYNTHGGLSYLEMAKHFAPFRILREVRELPVEKYDLILNDFESITAMACAFKKIPSVNFGHQASFKSAKTPRPEKKDFVGEWILQHYARANQYIGLHFESYDDFILPPVIQKSILQAEAMDEGHITVYLSSFGDRELMRRLQPIKDFKFQVFSKEAKQPVIIDNIEFIPVNREAFSKSLISCHGIMTGAGFETPAEALWLGKKLLVIPIGGQYEQECNGEALKRMGVTKLKTLDENFSSDFSQWINSTHLIKYRPALDTESIIRFVMSQSIRNKQASDISIGGFATS
jgi:uncharacterized protein (TIGR00661 family)